MKKMRQPFILLFAAFLPGSLLFLQSGIPNSAPQFDHIALHLRDLQKSSEFYAKVMRWEKVPEPFKDGRHILVSHSRIVGHFHEKAADAISLQPPCGK
jgi:hypothetical protein